MAVAFLPVFYSKHALNDVVTLAPVTLALVACLLVYERGRRIDWALAGGAIGAATATKYTAGAMLLTVAVAAGAAGPAATARSCAARVVGLVARRRRLRRRCSSMLNPYVIVNPREARGQISGQSRPGRHRQARPGRHVRLDLLPRHAELGLRLAAAARRGRRRGRGRSGATGGAALLLVAFPLCFYLYMGAQGRFFGRWLLPDLPGAVRARGLSRRSRGAGAGVARARRAAGVLAGSPRCCASRDCSRASTSTACSGARTRARRRCAGSRANVPPGAPLVVEPFVPASWRDALQRPLYPVERPFQAYEKRLRVAPHRPLPAPGYCWVVVGSHAEGARAEGRAAQLAQLLPGARRGERADRDVLAVRAPAPDPVRFSYDSSFNYHPRAFERPGPVVEIHRLRDCTPAVG